MSQFTALYLWLENVENASVCPIEETSQTMWPQWPKRMAEKRYGPHEMESGPMEGRSVYSARMGWMQ